MINGSHEPSTNLFPPTTAVELFTARDRNETIPTASAASENATAITRRQKTASKSVLVAQPNPGWVAVIVVACLVAIGISSYLVWVSLTSAKVAGCGGGQVFDCNDVISSRWSRWFGLPVSGLALGLYITLLAATIVASTRKSSPIFQRRAWMLVVVLGFAAGLAAIWFISLQLFVVRHLCTYCLAAHGCGIIVVAVLFWKRPLESKTICLLSLASCLGVSVLIAGQIFVKPVTYQIIEFESSGESDTSEIEMFDAPSVFESPAESSTEPEQKSSEENKSQSGSEGGAKRLKLRLNRNISMLQLALVMLRMESNSTLHAGWIGSSHAIGELPKKAEADRQDESKSTDSTDADRLPQERRVVSTSGGTIKLDISQWPISGQQSAKYVFVEMYDYTCDHCRRTHIAIAGANKILGDDMAVICLPVPLNTKCNSAISVTGVRMAEACEIAQLAVAVWRVEPAKFSEFHDYLMTTPTTATLAQAKSKANQLVDREKLETELNSGMPSKYIASHVELYRKVGAGNVPKLLLPSSTIVGEYTSVNGLVQLLKEQVK